MSGAWLLQNVAVVATIIVVLVSDGGVVARQDTSCGKESESGFKPGHRREPSHEDDDVTGRHNTWRFSRGDCKRKLGKTDLFLCFLGSFRFMWKDYLHQTWVAFFFSVLRPMWKWVLRKWTGRCELLRITYDNPKGAKRTKAIEWSLQRSNISTLKQLSKDEIIDVIPVSEEVMKIKDIITEVHPEFAYAFQVCLCQICGYKRLFAEVEEMRKTQYSSDNPDHEEKLMQLWGSLMPDVKLETRITKQWTDIGFQGEDPKTDFRGMGMLGLNQLLYISSKYTALSRQMLSKSHHPTYGFSYAIVGINLTSVLYELMKKQTLRTHFYNIKDEKPSLHDFHELYCYLFKEFVTFWFEEKPKDIMEFGRLRDKFKRKIKDKLKKDPSTILKFDGQEELRV